MKAIILAATHEKAKEFYGEEVPVPLLDLGKKPMLTVLVERLVGIQSLEDIYIVTNQAIKPKLNAWAEQLSKPYPIHILSDGTSTYENRLGAVGDIVYTLDKADIADDLLIVGGSNWFTFDLNTFLLKCQGKSPAVIITSLKATGINCQRFGWVCVAEDNRITKFVEKPEFFDSNLKASCIYYFAKEDLKWFGEYYRQYSSPSTPGDLFAWLTQQTDCYGLEMDGVWYDIVHSSHSSLTGPDLLEIRNRMREIISVAHSTWEGDAASELYYVSSYTDLLDVLIDKDSNRKLIAIAVLGRIGHLLNEEGKNESIKRLCECLQDHSTNNYAYGIYECDENETPVYVNQEACKSLVNLGFGETESQVLTRAKLEGFKVFDDAL